MNDEKKYRVNTWGIKMLMEDNVTDDELLENDDGDEKVMGEDFEKKMKKNGFSYCSRFL